MLMPTIYPVTSHTDHVGPGSTFVVVKGMKEDGASYMRLALDRGATTIVLEEKAEIDADLLTEISQRAEVVRVPSARLALAQLSAEALGHPARSLRIIGITGTKGKTTTAFLVEHLLRTAGYKTALLSTVTNKILSHEFEAHLTTAQPDYLHVFLNLCRSQGVDFVIMEVAAQALSLHRVATLEFDTAVFTNFSLEHSEFYQTQDDYFNAKCALFAQVAPQGRIILNADDERVALSLPEEQPLFISLKQPAHVMGQVRQSTLSSLQLSITSGEKNYLISSPSLLGDFSAYNCMTALAIAEGYGISQEIIESSFATFEGVPGRLQRFTLPNNAVAFIDNAHTPSSIEALLSSVRPLTDHLIVVFGAGGDRDSTKRPHMGAAAARFADQIFLTTDNSRSEDPGAITEAIKAGIPQEHLSKVVSEPDRELAIRKAYAASEPGTIIALLGKGPVEYQHIKETKYPFSEKAILRSL